MFEKLKKKGYQVLTLHHAEAILKHDMAEAVTSFRRLLSDMKDRAKGLVRSGGEDEFAQCMCRILLDNDGCKKESFDTKKILHQMEKQPWCKTLSSNTFARM